MTNEQIEHGRAVQVTLDWDASPWNSAGNWCRQWSGLGRSGSRITQQAGQQRQPATASSARAGSAAPWTGPIVEAWVKRQRANIRERAVVGGYYTTLAAVRHA